MMKSTRNNWAYSFEIQTMPIPQARPRFFVRRIGARNVVGAYDPKQCKTFKEVVAWHAKAKALEHGLKSPIEGAIAIRLTFQMGENGKQRYHTKKPDIDNLAKAVKDALRGVIYHDDSQIVEAYLYKRYGKPKVRVEIETLEDGGG